MESYSRLDEFRILKKLGCGFAGKVKLGQDISSGKLFALKILSNKNAKIEKLVSMLKKEYDILKDLDHPSVVKVFDIKNGVYFSRQSTPPKNVTYAVLEFIPGGDLFDYILHANGFDENLTRYYFHQLIKTLKLIHESNVGHRDLKPENLLVDADFQLKIADFGFAIKLKPEIIDETYLGTDAYSAPEIEKGEAYDPKPSDVFSAGVILFVMYSGHKPFKKASNHDKYYRTLVLNNSVFWNFHSNQNQRKEYSQTFRDLANSMLSNNPKNRATIDDIINSDKWFNQPIDVPSAQLKMRQFAKEMNQINKLHVLENGGTNHRSHQSLESERLIIQPFNLSSLQAFPKTLGFMVQTKSIEMLAGLVSDIIEQLGGVVDEKIIKKLCVEINDYLHGNLSIEISFYQISKKEYIVGVLRKSGCYILYQKTKKRIYNAILQNCEK